jgi:hypothetical protein
VGALVRMRGVSVIEDPELPSLLLAKGDCRPTIYPISGDGPRHISNRSPARNRNCRRYGGQRELTSATLIDPAHLQVEGTVTCDAPALFVDIFLELRQRGGIFGFRSGFDSTFLNTCDVTPTALSILVTGGPFHPGAALFDAFAFACDETQCADDRSFGTVRIRR